MTRVRLSIALFAAALTGLGIGTRRAGAEEENAAGKNSLPVASFSGHSSGISTIAFSRDGRQVVSACSKDVITWDVATGREVSALRGAGGAVVAISPDGSSIAVASRSGPSAARDVLTVIGRESGAKRFSVESYPDWDRKTMYRPSIQGLAFSPDGKRLASGGSIGGRWIPEGVVTVWDVKAGKALHRFEKLPTSASSVCFSFDGKLVAASTVGTGGELPRGGEVWVWDVEKGKSVRTLHPKKPDYGEFVSTTDVAFSPDGKRLAASVSADSRGQAAGLIVPEGPVFIRVWELASGNDAQTLTGHSVEVGRLTYSPDGKLVASAGKDRTVRLWNAATGKPTAAIPFDVEQIDALAFSPDGKRVAAGGGSDGKSGVIRVWLCSAD